MTILQANFTLSCAQSPQNPLGGGVSAGGTVNAAFTAPIVLTKSTAQTAFAGLCRYTATRVYSSAVHGPLCSFGAAVCGASTGYTWPTQDVRYFAEPFRYNINPQVTPTIWGQLGWDVGMTFRFRNINGASQTDHWIILTRWAPLLTPCPVGLLFGIGNRNSYATRQRGLSRFSQYGVNPTSTQSWGHPAGQNTAYELWNGQQAVVDNFDVTIS
jgi:hypothetical protein